MVARYNITKSLSGSYCVNEGFLKDVEKLFKKTFNKNPKFTVKFKNDHEYVCHSSDEIFDYSTVRSESIERLRISSDTWSSDLYGEIDFSSGILSPNVFVVVSGDKDQCIVFERAVLSELKSIRSFYSFMRPKYKLDGFIFGILPVGLVIAATAVLGVELSFINFAVWSVAVLGAMLVLRALLFPKFEFNFGKGRSTTALRRTLVYFVFGTLFVGGIVAVYQDFIIRKFNNVFVSEAGVDAPPK